MTKKLEQLFDLPAETTIEDPKSSINDHVEHLRNIDAAIDKIDAIWCSGVLACQT
jgi:hypothetical protein